MTRKWRVAALVALGLIVPGAVAVAADRTGEPVAALAFTGPGGEAITLSVQQTETGGLCRDLKIGATDLPDEICAAFRASEELAPVVVRSDGLTVVYGTVSDRVRRVDVAISPNETQRGIPTEAVDGYDQRFWGIAVEGDQVLGSVTTRAKNGDIVGTVDIEPAALPLAGRAKKLADIEDFERKDNELYALAPRVLIDPVRRPEKRVKALCAATRSPIGPLAANECVTKKHQLQLTYTRGCSDPHVTIYGVGPASIRRAVADYGPDGKGELKVYRVPKSVGRRGVVLFGGKDGKARLRKVRVFNAAGAVSGVARMRQTECGPGDESVGGGIA